MTNYIGSSQITGPVFNWLINTTQRWCHYRLNKDFETDTVSIDVYDDEYLTNVVESFILENGKAKHWSYYFDQEKDQIYIIGYQNHYPKGDFKL